MVELVKRFYTTKEIGSLFPGLRTTRCRSGQVSNPIIAFHNNK